MLIFPPNHLLLTGLIDPAILALPAKLFVLQVLNFTQPIDSLGGSIKVFMRYLRVHEFRKLLYITNSLLKKLTSINVMNRSS